MSRPRCNDQCAWVCDYAVQSTCDITRTKYYCQTCDNVMSEPWGYRTYAQALRLVEAMTAPGGRLQLAEHQESG